jgi:N-acetyl-anhydromuramyl-L-alanine amidase AmpD
MDVAAAEKTLEQLRAYTVEVSKLYGIPPKGSKRNSYGPFAAGQPSGAITHYTASNWTPNRIRNLLTRFKPGGDQGVGVQFIIVDEIPERHRQIRDRYPLVSDIPSEIYYFGTEAFWQAGWFNKMSYGIEVRNVGRIFYDTSGKPFWNGGKLAYFGRAPIKVGDTYWEPYTKSQMIGCLAVHRMMALLHLICPERFLGHLHVTSTRIDPGPHFPIHEMREAALKPSTELLKTPFLAEFDDEPAVIDSCHVSEEALTKGLYRNDWDGKPGQDDDVYMEPVDEWSSDEKNSAARAATTGLAPLQLVSIQKRMSALGYYVDVLGAASPAFLESLRIFQARWKVRKGQRWIQARKVTGEIDADTIHRIGTMESQV